MKKIVLAFVLLTNLSFAHSISNVVDGSIVIIDTDCVIDIHDNQNQVKNVSIYSLEGQIVLNMDGSMQSNCIINLSHMPDGTYSVEVKTTSGYIFNSTINANQE